MHQGLGVDVDEHGGCARGRTMGAAVATHVDSGTTTSSPGPMSSASVARCSAEVPCGTTAACSMPR